jgi:hypothetical protein
VVIYSRLTLPTRWPTHPPAGVKNESELSLLLGGEVSMWQDEYVSSCMFQSPQTDSNFSTSTSTCIWPRSIIAAGSFWGYHPDFQTTDPDFNATFSQMRSRLVSRGVEACPCATLDSTGCNQMSKCGVGYCGPTPPPPPPKADVLRCRDYSTPANLECHTSWSGDPTLQIKPAPTTVTCATPTGELPSLQLRRLNSAMGS